MNKDAQATQIHTFITMDNHVRRNTAHVCLQAHTHTIIVHADKSTPEEEHTFAQTNTHSLDLVRTK